MARVVCISRAIGAGGDQIGRGVAQRLDFRFIDDEIIQDAAQRSGEPVELIADAERRKGFWERALNAMAVPGGGGGVPYEPSIERFNPPQKTEALIRDAITEIAARGSVVIAAQAAAMQLGGGPNVVRALITASDETRIARIRDEVGLDEKAAAKALRDSDKARNDYFRRFYQISDELPVHYDVVVNTDQVSFDQAISLIVALAT